MKKSVFILFFLSFGILFGQSGRIADKIQEINQNRQTFRNYQVFTKSLAQKTTKYNASANDVTVLDINPKELKRIAVESPQYLSLSIPYQNENVEVTLYKQQILTGDFKTQTESGEFVNYTPGNYYRGIVAGDANSLVAISFFENNVMGVISTLENGNIILGKSKDKLDYVSYSDKNLLGVNPFVCGTDELDYNQNIEHQISYDPATDSVAETDKCVRIYYEIAHNPYLMNGSDIDATFDWITGIQNNISTLYANDGINMLISTIKVWTIEDPYTGTYNYNLTTFSSSTTEFDGDLAHLVNYPSTTSVAYLDTLCTDYAFAYSGINMTYAEVPTYSWTIMAMTHEMGHALGSPHTHACAWNGNNTAIDGCGPAAGYSEGCDGPIPSDGGTIMSYCHLNNVGINLLKGFGPQPGALIRNNIESRSCLMTDCNIEPTICTFTIESMTTQYVGSNSIQVSLVDSQSDSWSYQIIPYGQPLGDNWQTADSPVFTISNLIENQYYYLYVTNICENGVVGGIKQELLLTGDFCNGALFTDTGGVNGNYGDMETFVKTFYPSESGNAVSISFNKLNFENNWDFLYVYNGDSINAPLFQGGTLTGYQNPGPTFVSTHSSGAITVQFVSDMMVNAEGWEAIVNCATMGVSDFNLDGISIYPNPTNDVLNIVSKQTKIESVGISDLTGRVLFINKGLQTNSSKIDMSSLAPGVYILTLKVEGKTLTKKVIRK